MEMGGIDDTVEGMADSEAGSTGDDDSNKDDVGSCSEKGASGGGIRSGESELERTKE